MPCRYVMERRKLKDKPRKILNLEERVQAIRMYDEIPVYQRVASAFKCSWEQIKNVVANRKEILKYYASCQIIDVMKDDPKVVRHKKINFLGNCMYEYIKRAHFHKLQTITDEVIRDRAMEFKEIINIEKFFPNRAWIRDFKSVFNIDLDHINQIIIAKKPQKSLNCKDIITYCAKEVDNALSSQPSSSRNQTNDDSDGNNTREMEDLDDNNDDEDDPLESFYDDGTGGTNDEGGDDEIINENEEGPTINYGDYEDYHDESQSQDVKPDIKELEKLNKNIDQKCSPAIIAPENIKEEPNDNHSILASCLLGIDKNLKRPLQKQPFKRPSSSSSSSTTTTSKQLPVTVNSYEEALKLMRPLEEFALFEEDFKAINLLNQLAEVYEKAKKRKRVEN